MGTFGNIGLLHEVGDNLPHADAGHGPEAGVTFAPLLLRLANGKRPLQTRKTIDRAYELNLSHDDPKLPVRQHVPMPDEPIEIPEGKGWSRFCKAYHKSVEDHMVKLRTIPTKKKKKTIKVVKKVVRRKPA